MSVILSDGTVITDDANPATGLKAGGHRSRFYLCLSAIANWAAQVQAWTAQAQAAAGAGGGTIFPVVNSGNAGQSLVLNAAGTAYLAAPAAPVFRNKVINGDFQVWQRGISFAGTYGAYTADRWRQWITSNFTLTRVIGVNSNFALKFSRNPGATDVSQFFLEQPFETNEIITLRNKVVTVSFFAKCGANYSAISTPLTVGLTCGTGTEMANLGTTYPGQSYPISQTLTLTTTLQKFTCSGTVAANATQMSLVFAGGINVGAAGADDSITIERVQLEEGSVATAFEHRPYGLESILCQRYYEKSYVDSVAAPTGASPNGIIVLPASAALGNGNPYGNITFKTAKRVAPTVTIYPYGSTTAGIVSTAGGTDLAASSGVATAISESRCEVNNFSGGGVTPASGGFAFHYVASAEL